MQAELKNGILIPPRSLVRGYARLSRLGFEMRRIENQIYDRTRYDRFPTKQDYRSWLVKAEHALKLFTREYEQLLNWLEAREPALHKEIYKIVKECQADDVEFNEEEKRTIERADALFALDTKNR